MSCGRCGSSSNCRQQQQQLRLPSHSFQLYQCQQHYHTALSIYANILRATATTTAATAEQNNCNQATSTCSSSNNNCNNATAKTNKCVFLSRSLRVCVCPRPVCAYVTLVNTKWNSAKCDISHDLCTNNDKSCNCQRQIAKPTAEAAAACSGPHTLLQLSCAVLAPSPLPLS